MCCPIHVPSLRFVPPPGRSILLSLPPWRLLANLMAWSLEYMPSVPLRPFAMSFVTTALAPSADLFAAGALLINKRGERFTDECDKPAYALPDQPDKVGYILLARSMAELFSAWPHFISTAPGVAYAYVDDYGRNRRDIFNAAPSLDALATMLRLPAAALSETVRKYNESAGNRPPLGEGPTSRWGRCAQCSCMRKAGLRLTANIACSAQVTSQSPGSTPPARQGRAACCSRGTATISAGPSPLAGGRGGMRRLRRRASYFRSSFSGEVTTMNTRSTSPVLEMA